MSAPRLSAVTVHSESLRQRVLHAGGWSLGGYVVSQAVRFGTNLVMTRLLAPEMYGIMAVATMILVGLAMFSDFGLRQAVVQSRRGNDPTFLNTVWVTKIGVGVLIAGGAGGVACALRAADWLGLLPPGTVYAEASLPYVVAVLGLGPLIGGFDSTRVMEASRNLALKKLVQMQILAQLAGLAAMLVLSLHYRSIWILVSGALVSTAASTLLSHVWLPGTKNRLRWDATAFRELMGFGRWVLQSSALGFLATIADKGLMAAILSASIMGVYSIAMLLLGAIEQLIVKVIGDVAFPALSEVARHRREDLRRTVYRFHTPISMAAAGTAGLLSQLSPLAVQSLYDARYRDAGWMMQILSLTLMALPARVHAVSFLATGVSRLQWNFSVFHTFTMWLCIALGFLLLGLPGALVGISTAYLLGVPVLLRWAHKQRTLDGPRELVVIPIFALAAGVGRLCA